MLNPNNVPTSKNVSLVLDECFDTLDMKLEKLIEYLQDFLNKIPEGDKQSAKFEYDAGYYDDAPTYNIRYTQTLTQEEITEANEAIELRKLELEQAKKKDEKNTRARELRELRRLEKKYRN